MKLKQGNVHKTYIFRDKVIQFLNPNFSVPHRRKVEKIIQLIRENGVLCPRILYQNKKKRVLEYLEGKFLDRFTVKQEKKAAKFLRKIHCILKQGKGITFFQPVRDFLQGEDIIWGDTKADNILWRNGEPVGIVDYDTITKGSFFYDVCMAMLMWPDRWSVKRAIGIAKAYGIQDKKISDIFRMYLLVKIKEISTHSVGLGYFSHRSRKYYQNRIKELNKIYEKSSNWRSV